MSWFLLVPILLTLIVFVIARLLLNSRDEPTSLHGLTVEALEYAAVTTGAAILVMMIWVIYFAWSHS